MRDVIAVVLAAIGLLIIVGGLLFSAFTTGECNGKGGVLLQGQCVKVERIQ